MNLFESPGGSWSAVSWATETVRAAFMVAGISLSGLVSQEMSDGASSKCPICYQVPGSGHKEEDEPCKRSLWIIWSKSSPHFGLWKVRDWFKPLEEVYCFG